MRERFPLRTVVLWGDVALGEPETDHEGPVEAGLHGTDGHEGAVGGLVHVVVVGSGVHEGGPTLVVPQRKVPDLVQHGGEQRRPVHHGRIDDLPESRTGALVDGGEDPEDEQHAPAPEIGHEIERWHGGLTATPDGRQGAGHGDVVDVVTGLGGERPVASVTGDAGIDQPRISLHAHIGAEPDALHDTGPEAFQHDVGVR